MGGCIGVCSRDCVGEVGDGIEKDAGCGMDDDWFAGCWIDFEGGDLSGFCAIKCS